jgi:hypothetical protein
MRKTRGQNKKEEMEESIITEENTITNLKKRISKEE